MGISDIIAIIGAAAWLPQIFQWVSNYFKKPRLQVISALTCMLGIDTYGPNIYFTASISSERRDAIITYISTRLRHESGEERLFEWMSVDEVQFNAQSLTSADEAMFVKKMKVLAIKAVQEILSERSIYFRDKPLGDQTVSKINHAKDNLKYLEKPPSKQSNQLMKNKDFKELEQFVTENIFWREGRYEMEMSFDIKGLKRPHEQTFAFALTRQDVETLKINTEVIRQQIHELLSGETAEKAIKWQFIWTQVR